MIREFLTEKLKKIIDIEDFELFYPPQNMGDLATNAALKEAKKKQANPMDVAKKIVESIGGNKELANIFSKVEAVKPGFINFHFSDSFLQNSVSEILQKGGEFASNNKGGGQKANIEFVSANPTGPLTMGNGRSAAYGNALANIMSFADWKVTREYFINDTGRQIDILGESVARRLLELDGEKVDYPDEMYKGEYIIDIAKEIKDKNIIKDIPGDLDSLKKPAGDYAVNRILEMIKNALGKFGIKYDVWFSEKELHKSEIPEILEKMEEKKLLYKEDNALWFKGSDFGLEKDAVVVKSTGQKSYLLADFAYAKNKLERGFDKIITILGTDHHGDVPRIRAGIKALGLPLEKFEFPVHQLVTLKKDGEILRMSKRKGSFIPLNQLMDELPADTIKFFFLLKSLNEHMEFDLALAKEQSSKNPVFYVQYAYARASGILAKATKEAIGVNNNPDLNILSNLKTPAEFNLIKEMIKLPGIISDISENHQVHNLAHYAIGLAVKFHKFYENSPALSAEEHLRDARLSLTVAAQSVLGKTLTLLGVSSPEKM